MRNATERVATVQKGEDQGGGKDLTDSLIMQQKERIREGVKSIGGRAMLRSALRRFRREKSRLGPGVMCDSLIICNRPSKSFYLR